MGNYGKQSGPSWYIVNGYEKDGRDAVIAIFAKNISNAINKYKAIKWANNKYSSVKSLAEEEARNLESRIIGEGKVPMELAKQHFYYLTKKDFSKRKPIKYYMDY